MFGRALPIPASLCQQARSAMCQDRFNVFFVKNLHSRMAVKFCSSTWSLAGVHCIISDRSLSRQRSQHRSNNVSILHANSVLCFGLLLRGVRIEVCGWKMTPFSSPSSCRYCRYCKAGSGIAAGDPKFSFGCWVGCPTWRAAGQHTAPILSPNTARCQWAKLFFPIQVLVESGQFGKIVERKF